VRLSLPKTASATPRDLLASSPRSVTILTTYIPNLPSVFPDKAMWCTPLLLLATCGLLQRTPFRRLSSDESLGIPRALGAIKHIRIQPPFVCRITQLDFERDRSCSSKFTLDFQLRFRCT